MSPHASDGTEASEGTNTYNNTTYITTATGLLASSSTLGATRGVMVSTSVFASKHLPLECGFDFLLWLEFSGFGVWHFLKRAIWGLLWILQFPPFLHQ